MFENVTTTTAVLTLMPKFLLYSWVTTDCYTSICAVIFIAAAAELVELVDLADGFAKFAEGVGNLERQNHCQKLASRPMRSLEICY